MISILDVFRYIFNTVRLCSNNTYKWNDITVKAFCDVRHDRITATDENGVQLEISLAMHNLSINDIDDYGLFYDGHIVDHAVAIVEIRPIYSNSKFIPYEMAEITDEFKIEDLVQPEYVEYLKKHFDALTTITETKCIDPHYKGRIWMLHSFGDNYMEQDFNVMGKIKKRIGGTPVCILFMDYKSNETSFEECERVGLYNFIDEGAGQATLVILKVDSIEIKDSICYIKGKYPDRIDDPMDTFFGTYAMFPVELVLYEELNIDRGDTNG